eukprot:COSAG02_NODE_4510_length_5279_cov_14.934176_4_plen_177_part_00
MISQVEEGPPIDTGRFPIPAGFRYLLDATFQKGEFVDLCWDANRVLYRHREELKEHWCALLVQRGLNDKLLFDEVPGKLPRSAIGPLFMSCEMLHVFVPVCFLITVPVCCVFHAAEYRKSATEIEHTSRSSGHGARWDGKGSMCHLVERYHARARRLPSKMIMHKAHLVLHEGTCF